MKLIDKDALVAEIERRIKKYAALDVGNSEELEAIYGAKCKTLIDILKFLDTLEVKEVKEEPVSNDLEEAIGQSFIYHENRGDDFRSDKQIETAYRYGFESGFKYKESTSIIEDMEKQNLETKEVDLENEFESFLDNIEGVPRMWHSDEQIEWAKDIAQHFFELGLKTQKRE